MLHTYAFWLPSVTDCDRGPVGLTEEGLLAIKNAKYSWYKEPEWLSDPETVTWLIRPYERIKYVKEFLAIWGN